MSVALPLSIPFTGSRDLREVGESLRLLIKAVEQSPVSVIITDTKGIIQYVNPKFTQLMGYTSEEAVGKTPRIIKGGFLSRDFYREMWQTLEAGNEWHGVFHNRTKAGTLVWEVASISPIRNDAGIVTHYVGVKEDITELKRLQEEVEHLAHHDQLTGLPNRYLFNDRLDHLLLQAKRRRRPFAVLCLDLDQFKPVNDQFGHAAGDAVLVEAGRRLRACVREADTVARLGGDEFGILLDDIQAAENAERVAGLIRAAFAEPFLVGGHTCQLGVSIGAACYPRDGEVVDALLSRADHAMYAAKTSRAEPMG